MKKLYFCDLIVPMNEKPILKNGFISVEEGLIQDIGDSKISTDSSSEIIKLKNSLVLPGLINSHIHLAYERNFAEVKATKQLDWMASLINSSRPQATEHKRNIAKRNLELALKCGITSLIENTPFEEIVEELANSPVRALVGLEVFGNDSIKAKEIFESVLEKIKKLEEQYKDSNLSFTLSPHTIYNVSADLLKLVSEWAKQSNKTWLTHLAEFDFESDLTLNGVSSQALKEFHERFKLSQASLNGLKNKTPITYLNELGCLNENLLATHLVQATEEDMKLLAKQKVKVASCPRSNAYLLNGTANIELMFANNLQPSIATDGLSSNFSLDLISEIKTAWHIHRSQGFNISAQFLWHSITSIPAEQIAWNVGSLEAGKAADFIVFELTDSQVDLLNRLKGEEVYNFMLSELNSSMITKVCIAGVPLETG